MKITCIKIHCILTKKNVYHPVALIAIIKKWNIGNTQLINTIYFIKVKYMLYTSWCLMVFRAFSITNIHYTVLYTSFSENRLNWTVRLICDIMQCTYTEGQDRQCVNYAGSIQLAMQYKQFLDMNFKYSSTICSPGIKHVWELEEVSSNIYCNMQ